MKLKEVHVTKRKWWFPGILALAAAALVAAACAPAAAPTPAPTKAPAAAAATPTAAPAKAAPAPATPTAAPAPAKVRFASPGFLSDAGVFIAMDKGYFKEQAIDMEWVTIKTASDAPPLLARGDIEVAGGGSSAALYNAITRGIDLKIVADKGSCQKGFGYGILVVRKDLADTIKTAADLRGKKIATNCRNCVSDYFISRILKQGNLTPKDADVVDIAANDIIVGLANKSLDAAYMNEPTASRAAEQGFGSLLQACDVIEPGAQTAQIITTDAFLKNVDAARRWMVAYVKGLRDYNDAFAKNKNRADIIPILAKYTGEKDLTLYDKMIMAGLHPDGKVNPDSLINQQDFFIEIGGMKERVDMKKVIDQQAVEYAAQKLGPYR